MSLFVDYKQIRSDIAAAVAAAGLGFKAVLEEAGDRDFTTTNMPLLDLRFRRAIPQNTSGQTYYVDITLEAEIACFDMTSRLDAAIIRDDLTAKLQRFFQENPRVGSAGDGAQIGSVEFQTDESKKEGCFVASAVAEFHVFFYADR